MRASQYEPDAPERVKYWKGLDPSDEPEPETEPTDRGDLIDDGRTLGHGESYAERNT